MFFMIKVRRTREDYDLNIKTKTRVVKPSIMLEALLTFIKEVEKVRLDKI